VRGADRQAGRARGWQVCADCAEASAGSYRYRLDGQGPFPTRPTVPARGRPRPFGDRRTTFVPLKDQGWPGVPRRSSSCLSSVARARREPLPVYRATGVLPSGSERGRDDAWRLEGVRSWGTTASTCLPRRVLRARRTTSTPGGRGASLGLALYCDVVYTLRAGPATTAPACSPDYSRRPTRGGAALRQPRRPNSRDGARVLHRERVPNWRSTSTYMTASASTRPRAPRTMDHTLHRELASRVPRRRFPSAGS